MELHIERVFYKFFTLTYVVALMLNWWMVITHSLTSLMISPGVVIFIPYMNDLRHLISLRYLRVC
jgi:hypothetical protein